MFRKPQLVKAVYWAAIVIPTGFFFTNKSKITYLCGYFCGGSTEVVSFFAIMEIITLRISLADLMINDTIVDGVALVTEITVVLKIIKKVVLRHCTRAIFS